MTSLSPHQIAQGIRYRIIRPAKWKRYTLGRILASTDDEFVLFCGWSASADDLVRFLGKEFSQRFFFHSRNRKDFFLSTLTSTQPLESILDDADHVLEDRFQTLGSPLINLGPNPWHRDFVSGKEWPVIPASQIDLLDLGNPTDVKVPWELSRFHQVWWLGKAYWLTGNSSYSEKFAALITDWIDRNPPGYGVNWSIAMEAAIRACNWIAGYSFFCDAPNLSPDFWRKFIRNLLTHGLFIESHLEYSRVNGNHFLSNITGLIFLGVFFRDFSCGKRWLRWAVPQLETAMKEQVYDDGVNHEHSTSYHRLVLELFYSAALLCKRNNIRLSEDFWKRLEKMFEYVMAYSRLDGSIPLIGDSDDGRLFRISMNQDVNDHRHALSVGALLFKRADFKQAAGRFDQEALWYFGGEGFETHQMLRETPRNPGSQAFPTAGFYVLRTDEAHIFTDAGVIGMRGRGGHGHNDTLSFELWFRGAPFVVDPGTYTYTRDVTARNIFRSTRMHNTITVDESEQAEFGGLWNIVEDLTHPHVRRWISTSENDFLEAEHHGYSRLPSPVVHRRTFDFQKSPFRLTVTDLLAGSGEHQVDVYFHLHPDVRVEAKGQSQYLLICRASALLVEFDHPATIEQTMYSPSYGVKVNSLRLCVHAGTSFPFSITTQFKDAGDRP